MSAQTWRVSHPTSSRLFRASLLIGATLLLSSQAALAQFEQDGKKLVGMLATGAAEQGVAVAVSADGDTAIVGGYNDNDGAGAAWVFTRNGEVWTQQSGKLVGTGAAGEAWQGFSVALSADGDTAIVGGWQDNSNTGAAWVFTRSGGVWKQQGNKLVGAGEVGPAEFGETVALSADGDTAVVGGPHDDSKIGAIWVFTRSGGVWKQQGHKLVGTGAVGTDVEQGTSVALSADANTAIVGGLDDNNWIGATWVFTRSNGVWTQQGSKLVGTGAVGTAVRQGSSVAVSSDGNTAIVGGESDDGGNINSSGIGAAWVFTRGGGVWTQQGKKLVGTSAVGLSGQGHSVSLSADGDTAIVGGPFDNCTSNCDTAHPSAVGAAWVFTRSGAVWKQTGGKLVGTGAVGEAAQGVSVALSGDGEAAIVGGPFDNSVGAAWVFVQPLEVAPYTDIAASGTKGGSFSPSSFSYKLRATSGSVKYSITGAPSWLTASSTSGTVTAAGKTVTFKVNSSADKLAPGAHVGTIEFKNTAGTQPSISRAATLTVNR